MLMRKLGRTGSKVAALSLGGNTFGRTTDQPASEARRRGDGDARQGERVEGRVVKRVVAAAIMVLALSPAATLAQSLDAASAEALAATLRLLQDPAARSSAIAGNPQASAADSQLQALAGSANMQEVYALAAAIFSELAANSGGDVGKMSQALSRGTNDPAGFAAMLSPATLQRLRELSVKISDRPR